MESIVEIRRAFLRIMANSMSSNQIEYIAQEVDKKFDLYKESGFIKSMSIPSQTAAEAVIHYFKREDDIVSLFIAMLQHENKRFKGNTLVIQNKNQFMSILRKHKWIYDEYMNRFFRDPFYENEINFLKSLRTIDLRKDVPPGKIISEIENALKEFSLKILNWKATIRLFELDASNEELIRKVIELLLKSQNLERHTNDLFFCLKELASNASKANFKVVFGKYIAGPQGLDPDNDYKKFIENFKEEFKNPNDQLLDLVKKHDIFFNIYIQSSDDSIAIWVSNYANISTIEKKRIEKKLKSNTSQILNSDDEYAEGAGMGVNLVKEVLHNFTTDEDPIKLIFYEQFFKIGFVLKREDLEKI